MHSHFDPLVLPGSSMSLKLVICTFLVCRRQDDFRLIDLNTSAHLAHRLVALGIGPFLVEDVQSSGRSLVLCLLTVGDGAAANHR